MAKVVNENGVLESSMISINCSSLVTKRRWQQRLIAHADSTAEELLNRALDAMDVPAPSMSAEEVEKQRGIIVRLCEKLGCEEELLCSAVEGNCDALDVLQEKYNALWQECRGFEADSLRNFKESKDKGLRVEELEKALAVAREEGKCVTDAKVLGSMSPFARRLLEETSARLSSRYGRPIGSMQVLVDMFLRYTIEQWNEWFYPFVLSKGEIMEMVHAEGGEEIRSIEQLREVLGFGLRKG